MASYFWSSTSSTDPTLGANWTKSDGTTGAAPASGDDVTIAAIPGVALASIAAADMSAVTLNSLTVGQTFTGTIGTTLPGETATLAEVDVTGSTSVCDLGPGVTWTNANVSSGGMLTSNSGSSGALSVSPGATATAQGTAAIATVNAGGATNLNHR